MTGTVGEWTRAAIEYRKGLVAPKTTWTEVDHARHGLPALLAHHQLRELRPVHVRDGVASMLRRGRARTSVRRSLIVLRAVTRFAIDHGGLELDPCAGVTVPRGLGRPPRQIHPFTIEELRAVVAAQRRFSPRADMTHVLGLTGLRWGELRELRAADVQLEPYPAVLVSRSRSDGMSEAKTTKSQRARRVPLVAEVAELIVPRAQGALPDSLLFPSSTGTPILGANFRRSVHWSATSRGRSIHDLRHTAATLWLGQGLDVKTVQTWLGHSTATLTTDVYGHWRGSDADAAALQRLQRGLLPYHP